MTDSILTSVKKLVGLDESYTAFDADLIMYINGSLAIMTQLGVGPDTGFMIEDETATWSDFLGDDPRLNSVKNYVVLKTRLQFDPPQTGFHVTAIEKQIEELEWRINIQREALLWRDPQAPLP